MLDGIVKNEKYSTNKRVRTWVFVFKKYSKCYYSICLVGNIIKHQAFALLNFYCNKSAINAMIAIMQ